MEKVKPSCSNWWQGSGWAETPRSRCAHASPSQSFEPNSFGQTLQFRINKVMPFKAEISALVYKVYGVIHT